MIWFACKKCGKVHGRGESSGGTMIFCECGNGITVPWESTAAEPVAPVVLSQAPKVPDLAPIQFDPVVIPTPASSSNPAPSSSYPSDPLRVEDEERPFRRGRTEKRDPDYCFNHQRRPRSETCADCEENFCVDCVVRFQGAYLCAPCKNFRARRQELPAPTSTIASASLIISLIAGPLMMCFLLASSATWSMRILSFLSLVPQLVAIGMGAWALREANRENKGGGQWAAVTGIAAASATCVMMVLMNLFVSRLV